MQESSRAIVHFVGGETFAVPQGEIETLVAAFGTDGMVRLQVGTRETWINPKLVTYVQMPSMPGQLSGDGAMGTADFDGMRAVPRLKVG